MTDMQHFAKLPTPVNAQDYARTYSSWSRQLVENLDSIHEKHCIRSALDNKKVKESKMTKLIENELEQRREKADKAMPDLYALIRTHGYEVINYAFNRIKEKQSRLKELEKKRQELQELERELADDKQQ